MHLFQLGEFQLHSGAISEFKIDCDALTEEDWRALAHVATRILPPFGRVEGIPRGGILLAKELERHATGSDKHPLLIVDDVWTTGGSMESYRAGRDAIGLVVFARSEVAEWVLPLFTCEAAL